MEKLSKEYKNILIEIEMAHKLIESRIVRGDINYIHCTEEFCIAYCEENRKLKKHIPKRIRHKIK